MKTQVIYDGVTFIVEACVPMGKDGFVNHHIDRFWEGANKTARRKKLNEVWKLMTDEAEDDTPEPEPVDEPTEVTE